MRGFAFFLSVSFLLLVISPNISGIKLPDAASRAEQTLQGLFRYYWTHDPQSIDIGFFFACGQIGGWGPPRQWTQCGCYTASACTDCYRWWDAVTLESVATYGIYTNTKEYMYIADQIFNHSPYNANWNATAICTFMDDFSWYGITYLRMYEWSKDPKWLNHSVALYNWIWDNGWDEPCGGFWWSNCLYTNYKNSITNMEMLHLASKLSYMFPNEPYYLHGAQRIWDWFFSFDNGYGLMSDKYLVSTGAVPERCCNFTSKPYSKCHNSKISGTSYNQGLLLSSSAYLYRRTGKQNYLEVGLRALEAILTNYTTKEGILVDEPRSYQTYENDLCWAGIDPGGDWYSFQGIFMLHLSYYTELLVEKGILPAKTLSRINDLIEKTSDAAWMRSAVWPPFNMTDACNTNGLSSNSSYPKFHWWWGQNVTQQIIPPDPRYFFHKTQLRCVGNDTQLWEGMIGSELNCTQKCDNDTSCSKYLYQTTQSAVPGTDCWIWSYNRSDHSCAQLDYNFNVGIKRPIGEATCSSQCGSKEPKKLIHGVCYCDSDCVKHLDCCLDYADFCVKGPPPTCKGLCNVVEARAIAGGGYCWCTSECNPWYTDNNSDGSCCPDYHEQCEKISMPTCLDARTQGSALNLFLAHLKLESITKNGK